MDGPNAQYTLFHRKEVPTYLLVMDPRCQGIFLCQFAMCLLPTLVYNTISMDACISGTSEIWLGPEPRWLDAYQNVLWTIQVSCGSGAKRNCFPYESSGISGKALTKAKASFSQSFESSPKLHSTSLGLLEGWVENLHVQIGSWQYDERQKHYL